MTWLTLLIGIPWIISGIKGHNRRHNARQAPAEAAQRYIARDDEDGDMPSPEEFKAIRRDALKHRVRFRESAEDAPDVSDIDPITGEVR